MDASTFYSEILFPHLEGFGRVTSIPNTISVRRFLLAVAIQESGLKHRYQVVGKGKAGPARGWWQFEEGGGVAGVLDHKATRGLALRWCAYCQVEPSPASVWRALEGHDALATGFARLLLYSDPTAIPTEERTAWVLYAHKLWKPGKPHPATWPNSWKTASEVVSNGHTA